jgi:hypothetical protein
VYVPVAPDFDVEDPLLFDDGAGDARPGDNGPGEAGPGEAGSWPAGLLATKALFVLVW